MLVQRNPVTTILTPEEALSNASRMTRDRIGAFAPLGHCVVLHRDGLMPMTMLSSRLASTVAELEQPISLSSFIESLRSGGADPYPLVLKLIVDRTVIICKASAEVPISLPESLQHVFPGAPEWRSVVSLGRTERILRDVYDTSQGLTYEQIYPWLYTGVPFGVSLAPHEGAASAIRRFDESSPEKSAECPLVKRAWRSTDSWVAWRKADVVKRESVAYKAYVGIHNDEVDVKFLRAFFAVFKSTEASAMKMPLNPLFTARPDRFVIYAEHQSHMEAMKPALRKLAAQFSRSFAVEIPFASQDPEQPAIHYGTDFRSTHSSWRESIATQVARLMAVCKQSESTFDEFKSTVSFALRYFCADTEHWRYVPSRRTQLQELAAC